MSKLKSRLNFEITFATLCFIYGLETVVSVLFTNTRTRQQYNASSLLKNFEYIVRLASACVRKQNKNLSLYITCNIQSEFTASTAILNLNNARFPCIIVNNTRKTCCVAR